MPALARQRLLRASAASSTSQLGGFGGAPKFPRPVVFNFLLRYYARTRQPRKRCDMVLLTLREMAEGGMHDQLGGGFHRYSVDERWFVPHFEKMLYDQAQLAVSYLEAFQITARTALRRGRARHLRLRAARPDAIPRAASTPPKTPTRAIDPSQPGREERRRVLCLDAAPNSTRCSARRSRLVRAATTAARTTATSTTTRTANSPAATSSTRPSPSRPADAAELAACKQILLDDRSRRPRPHLDDKLLTAWNALMISALARGAQVFAALDPAVAARYRDAATAAARFIQSNLYDSETRTLYRRWRDGERAIEAFLDDYAALTQAHLDLYEVSFDTRYLDFARRSPTPCWSALKIPSAASLLGRSADLVLRLRTTTTALSPPATRWPPARCCASPPTLATSLIARPRYASSALSLRV